MEDPPVIKKCPCGEPTLFGEGVDPWCGKESCISRTNPTPMSPLVSNQDIQSNKKPIILKPWNTCIHCGKFASDYEGRNYNYEPECETCVHPSMYDPDGDLDDDPDDDPDDNPDDDPYYFYPMDNCHEACDICGKYKCDPNCE